MVNVSHLVRQYVSKRPLIQEAMLEGVLNTGALAEQLKPRIDRELGKKVKHSAIVMALRRHGENLSKPLTSKFKYKSEIIIKTGICNMAVAKSPELFEKLKKAYSLADYNKGDTLNVVHGNYEVSLVVSEKFVDKLRGLLEGVKIINIEKSLISLTLRFDERFLSTPGVIATITRKLAWNNINIFEIVSTMTELNLIIHKKDLSRAYDTLREMMESG